MKLILPIIVLGLSLFIVTTQIHSLEADQYRVWKIDELQDSSQIIDQKLNELFETFLEEKINWRVEKDLLQETEVQNRNLESKYTKYRREVQKVTEPFSAREVTEKFYKYIRPHFFKNRLKTWLVKKSDADVFPKKKGLFKDYKESIWRGFAWPFMMPVAQNIKINEVYIGSDKIDHFFSSGRRYFKKYLSSKDKGLSHEDSLKKGIKFGLGLIEERGLLGFWSSGAFAYADLESNYQGMLMAVDLCCAENSPLKLNKNHQWVLTRPIKFSSYVNPMWDEAYNNSRYITPRFRKIKKVLKKEYCELGRQERAQNLWKLYDLKVKESVNTKYLQELIKDEKIPDPEPHSLAAICNYPDDEMDGVPYW